MSNAQLEPLANGKYDVIVAGTGLKECIISGLLSLAGKEVLYISHIKTYKRSCTSIAASAMALI